MNFLIYPLGMLGFYVCGFAFMFGGVGTDRRAGRHAGGSTHEFTIPALRARRSGCSAGRASSSTGSVV